MLVIIRDIALDRKRSCSFLVSALITGMRLLHFTTLSFQTGRCEMFVTMRAAMLWLMCLPFVFASDVMTLDWRDSIYNPVLD